MARNNVIRVLRTSRAALDAQAGSAGLLVGEPYLITDESRLAVALTTTTYQDFAKLSEAGGGGGGGGTVAKYAASIGDGATTTFTLTHNLGTKDVVVAVRYASAPEDAVLVDWRPTTTNALEVGPFDVAPTTNQFRVVVMG